MTTDRNFDPIADHFAHKVYGGLKGRIRLAVLARDLASYQASPRPLRVLDVGAGLAQLSLDFARHHNVIINDISANMLAKARAAAADMGVSPTFITYPYQALPEHLTGQKFDLILCHALLEWLAHPAEIMAFFDEHLSDDGTLSLCFYNPVSLIYRNLIMGNFYQLNNPRAADNKSLTPNHPVAIDDVQTWLDTHGYQVVGRSGIRVFSDYAPLKRGGHTNADDVVAMELKYSQMHPFWQMGRYVHLLAKKKLPI